MEQNTQAFTSGQGRGAATILQPYDPSQDVAQTINIMRTARQKQDEQKQAKLAELEKLNLEKGKFWNRYREDYEKSYNEYKSDYTTTAANYENKLIPNSEKLRLQQKRNEQLSLGDATLQAKIAYDKWYADLREGVESGKVDEQASLQAAQEHEAWAEEEAKKNGVSSAYYLNYTAVPLKLKTEPFELKPIDAPITITETPGSIVKIGDNEYLTTTTVKKADLKSAWGKNWNTIKYEARNGNESAKKEMIALTTRASEKGMTVEEYISEFKGDANSDEVISSLNRNVRVGETGSTKQYQAVTKDKDDFSGKSGYDAYKRGGYLVVTNDEEGAYVMGSDGKATYTNAKIPKITTKKDNKGMTFESVKTIRDEETGTWANADKKSITFDQVPNMRYHSAEKQWVLIGTVDGKTMAIPANAQNTGAILQRLNANTLGENKSKLADDILTNLESQGVDPNAIQSLDELFKAQGFVSDRNTRKTTTGTQNNTTKNNGFAGQAKRAM